MSEHDTTAAEEIRRLADELYERYTPDTPQVAGIRSDMYFRADDLARAAAGPKSPGMVVDGDLLRDVVADSIPRYLTDDVARDIANTVLDRAVAAGMTVLHDPGLKPRPPTPGRTLADKIRAAGVEGEHPSRGPLVSVAAVLTLLDGEDR